MARKKFRIDLLNLQDKQTVKDAIRHAWGHRFGTTPRRNNVLLFESCIRSHDNVFNTMCVYCAVYGQQYYMELTYYKRGGSSSVSIKEVSEYNNIWEENNE